MHGGIVLTENVKETAVATGRVQEGGHLHTGGLQRLADGMDDSVRGVERTEHGVLQALDIRAVCRLAAAVLHQQLMEAEGVTHIGPVTLHPGVLTGGEQPAAFLLVIGMTDGVHNELQTAKTAVFA